MQIHHKENQPLEVMKLLTLYMVETSRVVCDYPMDTVCIVFNLENFTLANMVIICNTKSKLAFEKLNVLLKLGFRYCQILSRVLPSILSRNIGTRLYS